MMDDVSGSNMKVDLSRAVRSYKKVDIYDSINEAIVNSLQANATTISINVETTQDLVESLINKIIITDDGDGFNKQNRESFLHLYSDYKAEYGCKGIGRLSYLKAFKNINVESKQNNELVKFDFSPKFDESKLNSSKIESNEKSTILSLETPIKEEIFIITRMFARITQNGIVFLFLGGLRKITELNSVMTSKYLKKLLNTDKSTIQT